MSAELASGFAVWVTTPDAGFPHGRFVQAAWDVNELMAGTMRERIEKHSFSFKVGIFGFHP